MYYSKHKARITCDISDNRQWLTGAINSKTDVVDFNRYFINVIFISFPIK
jgi:hypothetical protein